ncbi:MAG: hypothetical protein J0J01_18320 [Reyranella sp.]|uniref:GTPase-associated system all-helical protein GASH n=1 Tax=Reyranella sp. TaxID=1929291 RepID=UPI001AC2B54F|nr:GTPase-associated system all-helical protein GASH [Reyranella sp.]MBN9088866.1 hypothetical protein [Reyranella sp.]
MSDEILLKFLEAGVLNVGSDDTKLEKLRDTTKDLAAALEKTPARTTQWTLVAVDPEIPAQDPIVAEAWTALKKNWVTVVNSYQSVPIALLRASLLDALVQSAAKNDAIAVAFANSARNMLPHMPLGDEAGVWQAAVERVEDLVDAKAEAEWTTPEAVQIAPMAYDGAGDIKIGGGGSVLKRESLQAKILAAAGATGGNNANPHWPNNNPSAWAQEFASRMTVAVADAIDAVSKANAIAPVDLSPPLKDLASAVGGYVGDVMQAFSAATSGLQRRANLLWWKEALYSPSARISYRVMEPFSAASIMALDLFEQVPTFSPASVSAFLNEAILLLPKVSAREDTSVPKIVADLLSDVQTAPLREVAKGCAPSSEGRRPVLTIIGHVSPETVSGIAFRQAVGLGDDVRMGPAQWGAHLFRELQAARATQTANPKRPRRKA